MLINVQTINPNECNSIDDLPQAYLYQFKVIPCQKWKVPCGQKTVQPKSIWEVLKTLVAMSPTYDGTILTFKIDFMHQHRLKVIVDALRVVEEGDLIFQTWIDFNSGSNSESI